MAPTTYSEPAASQLSWAGLGISWSAGTTVWVAWLDRWKLNPQYLVTDGEIADVGTDLDDDTGQVAALAGRKSGGKLLVQRAGANGRLAGIDSGRANLDEHLAGPGTGLSISATYKTSRPP